MDDTSTGETTYLAPAALLPDGWRSDVSVTVDAQGTISAVGSLDPDGAERRSAPDVVALSGPVVAGVPNLHSHAFQRAMAGLAEVGSAEGDDSFWVWREVMYGFLGTLSPDDVEAIAAQVYVEMLEAGFTSVGEFHYLHNDPRGRPYDDPADMSLRILAAARAVGIGLTVLPVLYMTGGFGSLPAQPAQRRFVTDPDHALDLFLRLGAETRSRPLERVGFAFHSLRAVPPWAFDHVLAALGDTDVRLHIHAAEQRREVDECVAWSGARPVEWLLGHVGLDQRWCLVHATHMSTDEIEALASSGAVAGLCPTTEANLGDGAFGLVPFLEAGGVMGVGSDSHVSVSPVEELRWLEYGQRLATGRRNVVGTLSAEPTGGALLRRATGGGARALDQPVGSLAVGSRADLVVLDADNPVLLGRTGDEITDSWIFSGNRSAVRDVMVGGVWLVRDGEHRSRSQVADRYRAALRRLR